MLDRADRPLQAFLFIQKRRSQKDEVPHGDTVRDEKPRCPVEVFNRHLLVQCRQYFRMDGLKTERDFELRAELVTELDTDVIGQARMILDDHILEATDALDDRGMILSRNCLRIKKVAAVVKLDLPRRRQTL